MNQDDDIHRGNELQQDDPGSLFGSCSAVGRVVNVTDHHNRHLMASSAIQTPLI